MKRYIISLIIPLLFLACTNEDVVNVEDNQDGSVFSMVFDTDIQSFVDTRADKPSYPKKENLVQSLYVLVFDKEDGFEYKQEATLLQGSKYKVELISSKRPKILHFVVNYSDWGTFKDSDYLNYTDKELIPLLDSNIESETMGMWQKFDTPSAGLNSETLQGITISLIRNMSKIHVKSNDERFVVENFYMLNVASHGTMASFDTKTHEFVPSMIVQSPNATILPEVVAQEAPPAGAGESPLVPAKVIYSFEREYSSIDDTSFLIVEGKYKDETTFYKIALKNKGDIDDIQLERNYFYTLKFNNVAHNGFDSYDAAVEGNPSNGWHLDVEFDKYPIISQGKEVLDVKKTRIIITDNLSSPIRIQADYYDENGRLDNSKLSQIKVLSDPFGVISNATINKGLITINYYTSIPVDELVRTAKVRVQPVNSYLYRDIEIVHKKPYTFLNVHYTLNGVESTVDGAMLPFQGDEMKVYLSMSAEAHPILDTPFYIEIKTRDFVPSSSGVDDINKMRYEWINDADGGYARCTYFVGELRVGDDERVLTFKRLKEHTSKEDEDSPLVITSKQFEDINIDYAKHTHKYKFDGQYKIALTWWNIPESTGQVSVTDNSGKEVYSGNFWSDGKDCFVFLGSYDDSTKYTITLKTTFGTLPVRRVSYQAKLSDFLTLVSNGSRVEFS